MSKVESQAMSRHFYDAKSMTIRQTRKGWLQECLGCEAKTEFKWFNTTSGEAVQFAESVEKSECCTRFLCKGFQRFEMTAKELSTDEPILTMTRPWNCPSGNCKCCCYQQLQFTNPSDNNAPIGTFREECYCCLPQSTIRDTNNTPIFLIHPPSCCGGCCMDCFSKSDPGSCFTKCCGCSVPFHVFRVGKDHGTDAVPDGKVVKKIKSLATELFTDANAFDVEFPENATTDEKVMIAGSAVLINEMFFETSNQ